MDFKSALTKVCNEFSKEIIFQKRIISILDDYGAFRDIPYYKLFYKTILGFGNLAQLISQNQNEQAKTLHSFLAVSGLDEAKVKSFLTLIAECYYGITNSPVRNSSYQKSAYQNIANKPATDSLTQGRPNVTPSNKVRFMEVPLGERYLAFENALFRREASLFQKNSREVTFLIKDYLYGKDAHITLFICDSPQIVYKINIEILTGLTVDKYRKSFTDKVLGLYCRKYGDGYMTYCLPDAVYEWNLDDSEISISDELMKTVITYSLTTEEIRKQKLDMLRKSQEIERMKREQEELKKKREDEVNRLKAKRLFDDI